MRKNKRSKIRLGLPVAEQAKWIGMMIQTGMTYQRVADVLGTSPSRISSILNLNKRIGAVGACDLCGTVGNLDRHHDDYVHGIIRLLCKGCHVFTHHELKGFATKPNKRVAKKLIGRV